MKLLVLAMMLFSVGTGSVKQNVNHVDMVEFATMQSLENDKVKDVYIQMICWDWDHEYCRYNVVKCFVVDDEDEPMMMQIGKIWKLRIIGLYDWQCFVITTGVIKFSTYPMKRDPERENLRVFPYKLRRILTPTDLNGLTIVPKNSHE